MTVLIASFLHPRTKQLKFVSEAQRKAVHAYVKNEMIENNVPVPPPDLSESTAEDHSSEQTEQPPRKAPKLTDDESYMDWIDDIVKPLDNEVCNDDRNEQIERELQHYISEPSVKVDSLKWWCKMEPVFPNISALAKKYLCVPASSVPCERVFSMAGHLVNRRRAALSPENVNMLIFMNKNFNKI